MSLWHLEWLRLVRTRRLLILIGVYVFFGLVGPVTVRFLPEIIDRVGGNIEITVPEPTPALAVAQFASNAEQIGLLAVVFVAAASLSFDSNVEMAVFLRTRARVWTILQPRFVVNAAAALVALGLGATVALYETGVLIGWPDLTAFLAGIVLHGAYLVFAIAATTLAASFLRSVPATAIVTIGALIVLGLLSLLPTVAPWLPSTLIGALNALLRGEGLDFWRALGVTAVATVTFLAVATARLRTREI